MTNNNGEGDVQDLQFDRVVNEASGSSATDQPGVVCTRCRDPINTEYFDINGDPFCEPCRLALEADAVVPVGIRPLVTAGVFGAGAGVVGAAIYYAVMEIANLEIGIVAILIGYMVGRAVHKGAGNRGGRRFQILAVALTYAAVALAYAPIAIRAAFADNPAAPIASSEAAPLPRATGLEPAPAVTGPPSFAGLLFALLAMAGLLAALPVLVVLGTLPFGLISGLIIFIGMHQAWKMTGAPTLHILGPFRVGAAAVPTSA